MVISVLERRSEIGLRRALGSTRGQVRIQFLSGAILLALLGGAAGVGAASVATVIYAHAKGWYTWIDQRVQGGVNQDPSGRTAARPTLVVTQAVAGSSARLPTPNREPAGTRITSPAVASSG
jgi:ABC-type antimicrobial peptide transport system permease subunit